MASFKKDGNDRGGVPQIDGKGDRRLQFAGECMGQLFDKFNFAHAATRK